MPVPSIRLAAATAFAALLGAASASAQMSPPAPQSAPPAPSAPDTSAPGTNVPATGAPATGPDTTANTGTAANTNATVLSTGLTVKDNTGAAIGQITDMTADTSGAGSLVTIAMGADKFRVPSDKLAVQNGAAMINLTQAQIQDELHPKKRR